MATLVLTAAGTAIGGPIGGALGAMLGQTLDARLLAPKARQGPRLGDLAVQTSSYGTAIPKLFGTMRVAGTVIWATDLIERRATSGGGKGRPKSVDYSYAASFAVALSARPILSVGRIWADGKLLRGAGGDFKVKTGFRLQSGGEAQAVDPLIAAAEGAGQAPAFRGIAYAMFEEMELAEFGNRIPSLSFEVVADPGPVATAAIGAALSGQIVAAPNMPTVGGYAATGDSVRGAIEELAALDGLGLHDDGEQLVLGRAGGPVMEAPQGRESGKRELLRRAAAAVPDEVSLAYYEPERDYQPGMQRAAMGPGGARTERLSFAVALSSGEAKARAEARLDAVWRERISLTTHVSWRHAGLRPGRLVALAGEAGVWRVQRWTLGDMQVKLELARHAAGASGSVAASPGRTVSEPDRPHGPTILHLFDLPLPDAEGSGQAWLGAMAAGSGPGWRRAALSLSLDGGASWSDIGATAAPATIGTATNVLPAGGSALLDMAGAVEIALLDDAMNLLSCTDGQLARGANLARLGDELIQFGQAEHLGPAHWRLTRLLRGRRGTEWAAGSHWMGEPFGLIEAEAIRSVRLPDGTAPGTNALLLASGVGDAVPVVAAQAVKLAAVRPPSPVHVRVRADGAGGVILSWVRRSRQGWTWQGEADAPLGEESERYRLTLTGPGFARSVETGAALFHYPAAARAADGTGPVVATIVQLGTFAASAAASITFT